MFLVLLPFKMWYFFFLKIWFCLLLLIFSQFWYFHTPYLYDLHLRFMIFGKAQSQTFAELFGNRLKPGKRDKLLKQHTPKVSHLVSHRKCRLFQTHVASSFWPIWTYNYHYFSVIRERKIMTTAWCAVSVIQTPICCFFVLILNVSNSLVTVVAYDSTSALRSNQNYNKFKSFNCTVPSVH